MVDWLRRKFFCWLGRLPAGCGVLKPARVVQWDKKARTIDLKGDFCGIELVPCNRAMWVLVKDGGMPLDLALGHTIYFVTPYGHGRLDISGVRNPEVLGV